MNWTAGEIVNQVAVEVGLTSVSDPYTATDPNFIQLRTLLKTAGIELSQTRDWKNLIRECYATGDGNTEYFDLPDDFIRMVDQSGWNRTATLPLSNPLTSEQWQMLQARTATVSLNILYRIVQEQVVFYTALPLNEVVYMDYVSSYWVRTDGEPIPDKAYPTVASDIVVLEALVVSRLLKLKFLQAKGMDSQAAQAEYEAAFDAASAKEPAAVLNLSPAAATGYQWPGAWNVPDTGYGVP